ncbi:unnamed protein product [Cyprideis torosa]|uniref:UDP-N-acetylglucosamine transferase subunit ALG13 n=1 Tax=Cyprideis torosa TaxID=163714 RepID=A0A7R8ZMK1_9CRUS|nr:unnamed protein product [Cyprideis torosa]CAG0885982.1 unnamed protein product [Cyprideis torosa]
MTSVAAKATSPKIGRLRRLVDYLKLLYNDYKSVAVETFQDCEKHPFKTTRTLAGLGGLGYLISSNPDLQDFREKVTLYSQEISLVPADRRNPVAVEHILWLSRLQDQERIRRIDLGVCCLLYRANYGEDVDLFPAHCKYLNPVAKWPRKLLDIGFAVLDLCRNMVGDGRNDEGFRRTSGQLAFVTVGTTRFDSLVARVFREDFLDAMVESGFCKLVVQCGSSPCPVLTEGCDEWEGDKRGLAITCFRYKPSLTAYISEADLVIGHGGAGTCLEVCDARKRLIVIINEDLMGNHQAELAHQLARMGCASLGSLVALPSCVRDAVRAPLPAALPPRQTQKFQGFLDSLMFPGSHR